MLNNEEGRLYTGCDLNTSLDDMAALYAASPYVLAGLGACGAYSRQNGAARELLFQHS